LGSVLGRQFRHDVMLAFSGMSESDLAAQVGRLLEVGLLSVSGSAPGVLYTFHHALIQDAAYESLLKSDRRTLHGQAGDVLAEQFPEAAEFEPEVLARHFTAAEDYDKAVPLWLAAGQRAWLRSAAQESIAHLGAGLTLVDRLADPAARDSLELRLQSALGVVYFAVSYAAPQAQEAFLRAEELCERVPDVALKVPVLYGVGAFQTMKGDIRSGHQAFERLRTEADAAAQPRLQLYAQSVLTWSHFNRGEYDEAVAAADHMLRLYEAGALDGPRLSAADPKIISECFRAISLWSLGLADQARAASDGVLAHARALGDPYSLAYTLNFAALLVPEMCGERQLVLDRSEEGIRLAGELGYPFLEVFGSLWRAWAEGEDGDPEPALRSMDESFARLESLGVRYHYAQLLARKARLLLRAGQVDAAQLAISEAVAHVESSGERSIEPDVCLAQGEVLCAAGGEQRPLAEAAFRTALEIARDQGARAWQLRAAMALARLAAEDGDSPSARATLTPVLEGFIEGHDTTDLQQAGALLATLS
jgi:tetratricopeptide (TPR) repeat protein